MSRCCSADTITDYTSGDTVCTQCGLVLEERLTIHQYNTHETIHDDDEYFVNMCSELLASVQAPSGWLVDCMVIRDRLLQKSIRIDITFCVAIICVVSQQSDLYAESFKGVSSSKTIKDRISRIYLETGNVNSNIFARIGRSLGLSMKDISDLGVFYNMCTSQINQSPVAISCAVYVYHHELDIQFVARLNGIHVVTIRKALKCILNLKKH